MKHKTTIPELIQREGKWWGGLPPIIAYGTGWVTVSDWSKPHSHPMYKIRDWRMWHNFDAKLSDVKATVN